MEPAVQTLTFTGIDTDPFSGNTNYIDLSQVASLVNRRFYRQGLNWAVAGFKILSDGNPVALTLSKLPNTWVMANAWEKSMRTWNRMNNEALEETESVRPRFLDFKIYADAGHHNAGFGANLLPDSAMGSTAAPGEWEPSKVVFSNFGGVTVEDHELIAVGANYPGNSPITGFDAVSLIEGYAASRGLPNIADPNTPSDADDIGPSATPANWMSAIFNDGTGRDENVVEDMISENNVAPYPFENGPVVGAGTTYTDTMYPGGANQLVGLQSHDIEYVTGTTIGGTTRMKGGNFPCGLIAFTVINNGESPSQLTLQIDLVPGHHRGYLCEPMSEM